MTHMDLQGWTPLDVNNTSLKGSTRPPTDPIPHHGGDGGTADMIVDFRNGQNIAGILIVKSLAG